MKIAAGASLSVPSLFGCTPEITPTDQTTGLSLWSFSGDVTDTSALVWLRADAGMATLHRAVLRALFVRAFRENFAWIVVFAFTGLPGLLALATIEAARRAQARDALLPQVASETRERVDWLAARLFGVTLLLTGNSARAWPVLDNRLLDDEYPAQELVSDLCVAAAGLSPQVAVEPDVGLDITDARGLLLRTQVVWILLMAVSVIVGF